LARVRRNENLYQGAHGHLAKLVYFCRIKNQCARQMLRIAKIVDIRKRR